MGESRQRWSWPWLLTTLNWIYFENRVIAIFWKDELLPLWLNPRGIPTIGKRLRYRWKKALFGVVLACHQQCLRPGKQSGPGQIWTMCLNFSGAPSQSDTGGQSARKLNRSVYRVSPVLSQSWSIQRIAGAIILVPRWWPWLGYYGVLSGIGLKQCIRSESAGVRLLSLKVALQFSSASVFAAEEEISYFCLSIVISNKCETEVRSW